MLVWILVILAVVLYGLGCITMYTLLKYNKTKLNAINELVSKSMKVKVASKSVICTKIMAWPIIVISGEIYAVICRIKNNINIKIEDN